MFLQGISCRDSTEFQETSPNISAICCLPCWTLFVSLDSHVFWSLQISGGIFFARNFVVGHFLIPETVAQKDLHCQFLPIAVCNNLGPPFHPFLYHHDVHPQEFLVSPYSGLGTASIHIFGVKYFPICKYILYYYI